MDTKSSLVPRSDPSKPYAQDLEFEWLLCLCSGFQTKSRRLICNDVSSFRAPERNRVIVQTSLRDLKSRDLPPDARVPVKSPVHTLRDASRKRFAG
jgi:hypothetical protein